MTPEFISQRKEELLKLKEILEKDLSGFAKQTSDDNWETKYPQMNNEEEDKTDEVEEYENLLPIERSLEERLKNVNVALKKIEEGTYGKCECCDCEIPEERLIASPEAKNCNPCKCEGKDCCC